MDLYTGYYPAAGIIDFKFQMSEAVQ